LGPGQIPFCPVELIDQMQQHACCCISRLSICPTSSQPLSAHDAGVKKVQGLKLVQVLQLLLAPALASCQLEQAHL